MCPLTVSMQHFSEAPSGLDNTSLLLLSLAHSSLFPSPWRGREGVKKKKKKKRGGGWGGSGNNRLLSQEGLRKEEEKKGARGEKRRERNMGE